MVFEEEILKCMVIISVTLISLFVFYFDSTIKSIICLIIRECNWKCRKETNLALGSNYLRNTLYVFNIKISSLVNSG